MFLRNKQ